MSQTGSTNMRENCSCLSSVEHIFMKWGAAIEMRSLILMGVMESQNDNSSS